MRMRCRGCHAYAHVLQRSTTQSLYQEKTGPCDEVPTGHCAALPAVAGRIGENTPNGASRALSLSALSLMSCCGGGVSSDTGECSEGAGGRGGAKRSRGIMTRLILQAPGAI